MWHEGCKAQTGNILNGAYVNKSEGIASMPSMSRRASMTRAQVTEVAEEDVLQMTAELEQWCARLDALAAQLVASTRIDDHANLRALRAKYAIARARFDEFRIAGSAQWGLFKSSIERAWNDLEGAFAQWAN